MFGDVEKCAENRGVKALDTSGFCEFGSINRFDDRQNISFQPFQPLQQFSTRIVIMVIKFREAFSDICLFSYSMHQPLTNISFEVKHQIPDAVALLIGSEPQQCIIAFMKTLQQSRPVFTE